MDDSAVVSQCGAYRWHLTRLVDIIFQGDRVLFIMLNPSTADAETDDLTLRRCIGYARAWGYGSLAVVNLFGLRTTDPRNLRDHADPVGPHNDKYVLAAIRSVDDAAGLIVCAWGARGGYLARDRAVLGLIRSTGGSSPLTRGRPDPGDVLSCGAVGGGPRNRPKAPASRIHTPT